MTASPAASELNQGKELTELTERKRCPFCNGLTGVYERPWTGFGVVCDECGAEGPTKDTQYAAVEAWNRRSSEAPSRRGEGEKPLPFKLPVRVMRFRNRSDETSISHIGDSSGSWISSVPADYADAIVEALNKNTGAS